MTKWLITLRPRPAAALLAGAALLLGSCAGLEGRPEPLVTTSELVAIARDYALPGAWKTYTGMDSPLARKLYRDELIIAHLAAADARYRDFRRDIGFEMRSSGLTFDAILLGLSGAGSLSKKAADEIAVVTTGFVGLHGAIDRNVYFDKTLPALISAMDGERFRIATAIHRKMVRDDQAYPLVAALADIAEYEDAGRLDQAVVAIGQSAAVERKAAKDEYDQAVRYACTPSAELTKATRSLGDFNRKLFLAAIKELDAGKGAVADLGKLKLLASHYGVPTTGSIEEIAVGIVGAFNRGFCTVDQVTGFKQQLLKDFAGDQDLTRG
jgi:hypothetical protein